MKPAKQHWRLSGAEPDYRFSLANERTFLAWIRTALALLAGALLVHQFATSLKPAWVNLALSLALVAVAGTLCIAAYSRWKQNEFAMRHSKALPHTLLLPFMAASATVIAIVAAVILSLA